MKRKKFNVQETTDQKFSLAGQVHCFGLHHFYLVDIKHNSFFFDIKDALQYFLDFLGHSSFLTAMVMLYYSSIVTYGLVCFLDWYYDIDLITNERMISVDFKILSGRSITETPLADIVDIAEKKYGIIPAIFNYGELFFRTSAEKSYKMGQTRLI
jgi:hypothetical protein